MKGMLSTLLLLVALLAIKVQANVYGITFGIGGDDTLSLVQTVEVSSAGTFSPLVTNLVYVGSAATFDGISAFDEVNGIFYYTTDFEASFVYSVDVAKQSLGAPISISSLSVSEIVVDPVGKQVLITGAYDNQTNLIVSVPQSGPAAIVFNFSAEGIEYPFDAALDSKNGIYYFVYLDTTDNSLSLGQFDIRDPKTFKSSKYPCSAGLTPVDFYFDETKGGLVGYNNKASNDKYYYTEIIDGKCTEVLLSTAGIVTCGAYDASAGTLYMGVANNSGTYLQTYTSTSKAFTVITVDNVLTDIGVSYKSV